MTIPPDLKVTPISSASFLRRVARKGCQWWCLDPTQRASPATSSTYNPILSTPLFSSAKSVHAVPVPSESVSPRQNAMSFAAAGSSTGSRGNASTSGCSDGREVDSASKSVARRIASVVEESTGRSTVAAEEEYRVDQTRVCLRGWLERELTSFEPEEDGRDWMFRRLVRELRQGTTADRDRTPELTMSDPSCSKSERERRRDVARRHKGAKGHAGFG